MAGGSLQGVLNFGCRRKLIWIRPAWNVEGARTFHGRSVLALLLTVELVIAAAALPPLAAEIAARLVISSRAAARTSARSEGNACKASSSPCVSSRNKRCTSRRGDRGCLANARR